jgi:TonB family protein
MAMGTRKQREKQEDLWIAHAELASAPGHPLLVTLFAALVASARDKVENWLQVRSPHFIVLSNSSEKQARHVADQFERMRFVFHTVFPHANVDPGTPIVVLAVKDKKDFHALEPEAYLAKGQLDLAGLFLRAPDKSYILLRLDAQGEHPYATVYHEYTHLLSSRAEEWLPLWLNEGLAEFYQNTDIRDKEVWVGEPSPENILLLRRERLLPLPTLFTVDHNSPYYHEENKGSIFYAESWACTHYLQITDYQKNTHHLTDYAELVSQKVDAVTAATRVFGDLKQLQETLEKYVAQRSFYSFKASISTELADTAFKVQSLSSTQADAVRADFLAYDRRVKDARTLLERVLRDDPSNASAHETMGYLEFREGNLDEARKWYGESIKLDSHSFLAYYYFAAITMNHGQLNSENKSQVENSLRAAIKLNPSFAPAYEKLAMFFGMQRENLEEADMLILNAVQLDPGNLRYRLNTANILLQMQRGNDAIRVLQNAMSLAKTPEEVNSVQNLLQAAQEGQSPPQTEPSSSEQKQESLASDSSKRGPRQPDTGKVGGDYGLGVGRKPTAATGPIEVLTDTKGVNFGPYLQVVIHDVKVNWYNLIPESARAPIMKKGKVMIEFAILKNGTVAGMKLVSTSGDVALDRGAWGAITASNPFKPLPSEFDGPYLGLRFAFYYNPDKADLAVGPLASPTRTSSKSGIKVSISPDGVKVPIGGSEVVVPTVTGSTNTAVKWNVTGSGCSGTTCGTMSGDLYLAPSVLPSPPSVVLTATSEADTTASASVRVELVQPDPPR